MFKTILNYAQTHECSDIHLVALDVPIVREIGLIKRLNFDVLSLDFMNSLIHDLMDEHKREAYAAGHDVDLSYADEHHNRYRVNVFRQKGLPAITLRLLQNEIPTIDGLKLPEVLKDLAKEPRGLVLVTGPTGSGKSTTLAAMVNEINFHQKKHIITLEDPIEYLHSQKHCLINQRQIHTDTLSFKEALRSVLREDPDVIMVGEMRDFETMQLAITAAETGHLVFSTLHTTGAANTIDRIIDSFPPYQQSQIRAQLANTLKGVVSQVLIPKKDGSGRVAAHEILIMTDGIANLIRESKVHQIGTSMQIAQKSGMLIFEACLASLVREGVITKKVARELASSPQLLERLLPNTI